MAKELLDFDPWSGIATYTEELPERGGVFAVTSEQDCSAVVERATKYRNEGVKDDGIKRGMMHYCDIPNGVALELLKKGINLWRMPSDQWGPLFKEIETNYPMLKVTNRKMWRPK